MKLSSPKHLALINAFATVVFLTAAYLLIFPLIHHVFWTLLIVIILLFGFSYLIYFITIQKFIYAKIRLIYKTIHQLKMPKESRINVSTKADLDLVNKDVSDWATDKTREIEELKKLEAYRREFIGNVSHELKTPIFNIQGYVLTLLEGGLDDPAINREYLRRTEKSINRMIAIVKDLEIISHLESGELKLKIIKFDLLSLTKEVIEFLEMKAKEKNISIVFGDNYEPAVMVEGDREKIRQVLINLIDNSISYNDKNPGKTKISYFDMDENILVEVTDNGVGIDKKDIPRLFERFFRTDKARSRERGGTGLGLSIVKHIIEAHGQTINVRSTPGVGTTFAFTLKKG